MTTGRINQVTAMGTSDKTEAEQSSASIAKAKEWF